MNMAPNSLPHLARRNVCPPDTLHSVTDFHLVARHCYDTKRLNGDKSAKKIMEHFSGKRTVAAWSFTCITLTFLQYFFDACQ